MTVRKGICYFADFATAQPVRDAVRGRIVRYDLGFAVQFAPSSRYVGLSDLVAFCPETLTSR